MCGAVWLGVVWWDEWGVGFGEINRESERKKEREKEREREREIEREKEHEKNERGWTIEEDRENTGSTYRQSCRPRVAHLSAAAQTKAPQLGALRRNARHVPVVQGCQRPQLEDRQRRA